MIYGNTGAGLVDINIPQSPLYQQSLPNLRDVSASAWGIPSLDDITVPDVTPEKDIQTDTDLTQKYFDLATKLKEYAIKGRAVGIDVTKPKNDPTHLQFAQEWNKMYQDFLQTGKELKNAKKNQSEFERLKLNPNAMVGKPDMTKLFDNTQLQKYSLEQPFTGIKSIVSKWKKPISIYDDAQYKSYMQDWANDYAFVDKQVKELSASNPELADQIQLEGDAYREALMNPMLDTKSRAKFDQDASQFAQNLRHKKDILDFDKQKFYTKQEQDALTQGGFDATLEQLIGTPNTESIQAFGDYNTVEMGKPIFKPHKVIVVKGSDLTKVGATNKLKTPLGTIKDASPDMKYIVTTDGNGVKKVYPVNDEGITAFSQNYQQAFKKREDEAKQVLGTYDLFGNEVISNQPQQKVTSKTTTKNTQSGSTTTKKVTPTGKSKQLTKTLSTGRIVYSDDNGKTWHP